MWNYRFYSGNGKENGEHCVHVCIIYVNLGFKVELLSILGLLRNPSEWKYGSLLVVSIVPNKVPTRNPCPLNDVGSSDCSSRELMFVKYVP